VGVEQKKVAVGLVVYKELISQKWRHVKIGRLFGRNVSIVPVIVHNYCHSGPPGAGLGVIDLV
jgi:hypothetical protein